MKIEFIIPTYNRPHQLMGVISSIFSQTSPNWKIHVVADGVYDGALVMLAAALIALLVIAWATGGGGAGKIGQLFDRVIDSVTAKLP